MNNKIKIIVPFYNPGKFLDRCVNSLLTQDYDNYEILFIDDCSSDGSFSKIPAVKYKGDENYSFEQIIRDFQYIEIIDNYVSIDIDTSVWLGSDINEKTTLKSKGSKKLSFLINSTD